MHYLMNAKTGELWKICQLCFEPMCWVITYDEYDYEDIWWHCHDCDFRGCDDEETDED
jgi:hypothetical protein